ncbi:MAG: hypothetical protein FRX49_10230 [Trebouxia sp. A1-2]|nr:MAG: hypothetical protein FRX49_10230 [Trebouxia sp. A1-2]
MGTDLQATSYQASHSTAGLIGQALEVQRATVLILAPYPIQRVIMAVLVCEQYTSVMPRRYKLPAALQANIMEDSGCALLTDDKEIKVICRDFSVHYRTTISLCSARDIKEPVVTCGVATFIEVLGCVLQRSNKEAELTSNSLRVAVPVVPRPGSFWGEEDPRGGGACCILVWASLNTCNIRPKP